MASWRPVPGYAMQAGAGADARICPITMVCTAMALPPRPLIAGNWKMNGLREDAASLVGALAAKHAADAPRCDVVVCPPATLLAATRDLLAGSGIALGAQDCHPAEHGAHTGDVAAPMLADAGCAFVIVGHSERRADHGEDDAAVRAKAEAAYRAGLAAIICIGETAVERDAGKAVEVVRAQLDGSLPPGTGAADTVIAYEPIWAIGSGRTPTPDDVAEVHAAIRARLAERMSGAGDVRILYGGSVKPDNARELLAVTNVDGALVGGACLSADDFSAIWKSCP